jgi:hypothetical protein
MPRFTPHRSQLASPKIKKRCTVADAKAVVDRMAVSGLSVREFRGRGIGDAADLPLAQPSR